MGHAQRTPLKGQRFESLDEARAYLDKWEERWADTRIHGTTKRLGRAGRAGSHIGALCYAIHNRHGQVGIRRIQGVLSLAQKFGSSVVDDACAAALELGVHEYRFVRRYLERQPQLPLTLHQVDPIIRELVQYRDLIQKRLKEQENNELD